MSVVDIVIVSYSKDDICKDITKNCINSLLESEDNSHTLFNIIVVESQSGIKWEWMGSNIHTYDAPLPYGYHKFLNFGRKKGNSEWVALCNNDIIFTNKWFTNILKVAEANPEFMSFSPICPYTQPQYGIYVNSGNYLGYQIRCQISGWCIVHKRNIYDIIGDLDERFHHWYCDNDYSMTLQKHNIKHVLVTSSVVFHHNKDIGKITERVVKSEKEYNSLTIDSQKIFIDKWYKKV